YCKPECEKIYVGKKSGLHIKQQTHINDLIVEHALKDKVVIRLKGGDPFVFGRGHEEMEHAQAHGIAVDVVPGITSSIAVPASHFIPLTKRGINESFWVVTGTTRSEQFSDDLTQAAQSSATVVILMGMKNLSGIVEVFKSYRSEDEPIGVIMNGTMENELSVFGTLSDIEELVKSNGLSSPAIIVVGKVVNERIKEKS
ncbi:MAG: uroporphyrinogen-III C-methyltransferase, partial [bacterium]|nr:uroporphyrinogen-III C-methyltransferase [bacterium]